MKIIFINDGGFISVINPSPEWVDLIGIEAIALKDVPKDKAFKIVGDEDLPTDGSPQETWTIDSKLLTDGVGADYGAGSQNAVAGYDADADGVLRPVLVPLIERTPS